MAIAPERPALYEGSRIPRIPTLLETPEGLDDVMTVNFGPNHPSTHGVLRLVVDLHGEQVVGLEALMEGIVRLHEKVMAGVPPAYEIRGVAS